MSNKTITLYDVAARAGVSYQTVSRVINGAENVSARTRQNVEQAMQSLHYVPDPAARQLAGKRRRIWGLVTTDLSLHAPSQIAAAIKSQASQSGVDVSIAMLEDTSEQACCCALDTLLAQRVEAIAINLPLSANQASALVARYSHAPILFLDVPSNAPVPSVTFDATQGAVLGAEHLLSLPLTRIALLNGPLSSVSAAQRRAGWVDTLAQAGLQPVAQGEGDWSAASGYLQAQGLLRCQPQGILVANDQMALGVLRACAERGISVPGEICVVGFDDTADSAWFTPPLTTIRQDFRQLGESCVFWLNSVVGNKTPSSQCLPVTLVVRESTGKTGEGSSQPLDLAHQLHLLAEQVAKLA
ncbi:LacI family DNA-binding transcriptional regulator [Mangrovibacter yixingensis]|uniref:LacI family DNA-binding transcriptional regulator n=1 Tax=Mangrovibacter yixingensis TaxID=1529639 RepID=UPI001CFB645F|nr:LacI family DNA-binding transcriptional regulator [Mangrovibacter yixingensis]